MNYRRLATLIFLATFLAISQNVQACWHNRHCNCHRFSGYSYSGRAPISTFNSPVANSVSIQYVPATFFVPTRGVVSNGAQNQGVERNFLSSLATLKEILGLLTDVGKNVGGGSTSTSSGLALRVRQLETEVESNRIDIAALTQSQQAIANRIDNDLAELRAQIAGSSGRGTTATSANDELILEVKRLKVQIDRQTMLVNEQMRHVKMFANPAPEEPEDKIILDEARAELEAGEMELEKLNAEYAPLLEQFQNLLVP